MESENIELVDKKDVINEKNIDENSEEKERAIKNLRVTHSSPSEQRDELLQFIVRKEHKILELREELKRHEEELLLLKKQWQAISSEDINAENTSSIFSIPSNISNNIEVTGFMNGLGKGIHSVIGGIHNLKESEATREKLSQIKTAVSEVANIRSIQQTRQKTADLTSQAWSNISKGISSWSYKSVPTAETSETPTINTAISPTTSPGTTSPTSSISKDLIWSAINSDLDSEKKLSIDKDDSINEKNFNNEKIEGVLAGSPKDEFEEQLVYVIGDDFDLENLDLKRTYTFEEFEWINEQLKKNSIEIDGQPVDLFEFKDNKLVPMPLTPIKFEAVVLEIVAQLRNWNVMTGQNGIITSSQGGFNFNVGGKKTIEAPDVAFVPRRVYDNLTEQQRITFKGEPFSPIFVVEVANITKRSVFDKLDSKFKDDYLSEESAVQLGWLIDPENKEVFVYKRGRNRYHHGWKNVDGGETLPKFKLRVQLIEQVID
ncbi:5925_t:CDS:2, partial [Dentiscutata erythropus]